MKTKSSRTITLAAAFMFVLSGIVYSQSGKIAFRSCADGNCEIYLINPNGSGETRLTFHPAQDLNPSMSEIGTKIPWATNRDGSYEMYSMNPAAFVP